MGTARAKKIQPQDNFFFFLLSSVYPDVPGELFCHDSPVRAAPSTLQGHDVISLAPPVMKRSCHQLSETEMQQHQA